MKCPRCNGSGRVTCRYCSGQGSTMELNLNYIPIFGFPVPENHTCKYCSGSGEEKCGYCGGDGKFSDRK